MGLPVDLPPGSARRHASLCEDWYATKLQIRMPNATWLIEAALDRLNARCIYRRKAAGHARGGGLAVLLRGGAFRGSETPEVNRAAQIECALSVQRMIVRPFAELGDRVGVSRPQLRCAAREEAPSPPDLFLSCATHPPEPASNQPGV